LQNKRFVRKTAAIPAVLTILEKTAGRAPSTLDKIVNLSNNSVTAWYGRRRAFPVFWKSQKKKITEFFDQQIDFVGRRGN